MEDKNAAEEQMKSGVTAFAKQCFVTAAVGINVIGHGCVLGFPAILLPQLREPGSGLQLTKNEESWIASILVLCTLIGYFLTTPLMDRLGRKRTHIALTILFIAGWIMATLATDLKVHILARLILGISCGILNTLRSVLIGEYTSPKDRGAFLTTISLAQAFGIFFVHLIGSLLSWQKTALICAFLPFISLLMTTYTPESPSWLAKKGRYDECRTIFRWLRGDQEEKELQRMIEAQTELENEKIKNRITNNNWVKAALSTIVKREFYKPIILMVHINALMQLAGGPMLAVYSTIMLSLIMGPTANIYFWMVFLDTQRIMTNILAIYVIHRVKRRTMILSNGIICILSHLAIATYVYGKMQGWVKLQGVWFPALLVNIQIFTVGMALGPMPNIIAGEIFPLEYRSIGGTISLASSGLQIFLVLKSFPGLIDAMGLHGTYILYSILLFYFLVVIGVLLPETKGKTLQQIEDELRGKPLNLHEVQSKISLQSNGRN